MLGTHGVAGAQRASLSLSSLPRLLLQSSSLPLRSTDGAKSLDTVLNIHLLIRKIKKGGSSIRTTFCNINYFFEWQT